MFRARMVGVTAVGCAAISGLSAPVAAASLASDIAPISSDVRVGDLRSLIGGFFGSGTPEDHAFTFTPSLDIQEMITDNVFQQRSPRRADLVTTIVPSILLSGQSRTIQANISISPNIEVYANNPSQDQIFQQFDGSAQIALVPDEVFLKLRGFATQQSSNGNYGVNPSQNFSTSNRTNVFSVEASPYVTHRFGGYGTVQVGYTYSYTSETSKGGGNNLLSPVALAIAQANAINNGLINQTTGQNLGSSALGGNSITRSNDEYATFTSGENFGRLSYTLRLDASQQQGSGDSVLNGSHQSTVNNLFGYGINRTFTVLGSLGYENIYYSGTPPTRISDATWSGGLRVTPNESSTIVVKYGHQDGINAISASASYAATARLRLFAEYSESLTSSLGEIQSDLDNSTVDQFGNNINTVTGAPTLVADQLLSLQSSLYRLKRFSGSAVTVYDRDTLTLSLEQERRSLVASASGTNGYSDHGASASLTWGHQINPEIMTTASVRYGVDTIDSSVGGNEQNFSFDLSTSYSFSPTLIGRVEYFLRNQTSSLAGQNYLQNAVVLGLHKSF